MGLLTCPNSTATPGAIGFNLALQSRPLNAPPIVLDFSWIVFTTISYWANIEDTNINYPNYNWTMVSSSYTDNTNATTQIIIEVFPEDGKAIPSAVSAFPGGGVTLSCMP